MVRGESLHKWGWGGVWVGRKFRVCRISSSQDGLWHGIGRSFGLPRRRPTSHVPVAAHNVTAAVSISPGARGFRQWGLRQRDCSGFAPDSLFNFRSRVGSFGHQIRRKGSHSFFTAQRFPYKFFALALICNPRIANQSGKYFENQKFKAFR